MKNIKNIIIALAIVIILTVIIVAVVININLKNKEYEIEKVENYSYFKLYQNEKYGVIDKQANVLVEANYDIVNIPNPSKAVFICYYEYNETTGEYKTKVLNDKNEEILTQFEQILPFVCEDSNSAIPFEKSVLQYKENGKYGIIDFTGKKITKPIYDKIESLQYKEGCLKVEQNGKYGVINIKGTQMVKIQYDDIQSDSYYTEEKQYQEAGFIVQLKTDEGYRYGYVNKEGKEIIETQYNEINRVTEIKDNKNIYLLASKNGKYGIIKNKKNIVAHIYEEIEYNKANELFIVQKSSKQGVISIEGNEIIPIEYDYVLCTGNKITTKKGENIEIYNQKGEKQTSKYDNSIETSNENYTIIINENEKFGVINKSGQTIIEPKYEYIEYIFEDNFIATQNGKVGIISIGEGTKVDFKYDIIQKVKDKNVLQAITSNTNTIEMYNSKIEKQFAIKNAILYVYDDYIKLISDTDIKYLNNEGNIISNKEIFTNNTLFSYSKNSKWGFDNKEGNVVIEAQYDIVTEFNEYGFAGIKKDGKWGVVNEKGEIIVEPIYNIDWNEPEFIGKYCKMNFGYGFEYYTDELVK